MASYQIVLACALLACTAALYVDSYKKPSAAYPYGAASTYDDDAYSNQYRDGLYFDPSVKTYPKSSPSYNPSYKPESYNPSYKPEIYNPSYKPESYSPSYKPDNYNNQYNKGQYNYDQYNNDQYNGQYNNQYNNGQYNNQYKNGQYNSQYNNGQYNNQYNNDQYENGNQYNQNYKAKADYKQKDDDSNVGVYPCNKGDEGKKYAVVGACYAYYECVYGESLYRQCDDYYSFDNKTYTCVADKDCKYVPNPVPSEPSEKSYNNYDNNNQYNNYNKEQQYVKNGKYNNGYQYNNAYPYAKYDQYNGAYQYANNDQYNGNQYANNDQYKYANQYNKNYNVQPSYEQKEDDSQAGVYKCEKGYDGKKFAVVGVCYAYYECVNGEALYRQCDNYYRFDSKTYQCVADNECQYDASKPSTEEPSSYEKPSSYDKPYNYDNSYPNGKYPSYPRGKAYNYAKPY